MQYATHATAVLAALGLLAAPPAFAQSSADQPSSGTAPSGGVQTGGATGAMTRDVSDTQLQQYVEARRALQSSPEAWQAIQGGDTTGKEQSISTALAASGSSLTVEEFERIHKVVTSDPNLQARVERETGTSMSGTGTALPKPGQGAPLPSGTLGTGPASVSGGTPPGTRQPGIGAGAPTTDQAGGAEQSGAGGGRSGSKP